MPPPAINADETLAVVTTYLGSDETQVLRNAATALAAIGTPESAVHLADLAVLQADASVRRRATEELASLAEVSKQTAAQRARDLLLASDDRRGAGGDEPDPLAGLEQAGRANDLLVALRRQGITAALPEPPLSVLLDWLQRRLHPPLWARLTPVWKSIAAFSWYRKLFAKIRFYRVREQPRRPLWWALFVAFLWALPGAALTALTFWWLAPELGKHVYLGIGLPSALIAATLAAIFHFSAVPIARYCHGGLGVPLEIWGVIRRPGGAWWRQFLFPLAVGGVAVLGLTPMMLGFDDLGISPFYHLVWFLLATGGLLLIFAAMRAGAVVAALRWGRASSAVTGAVTGVVVGVALQGAVFLLKPRPGIAFLVIEGVILLPALTTAFFGEHLRAGKPPGRGPSRALVWPLIAMLIVILPGVWLFFNPPKLLEARQDLAHTSTWQLAHLPVERSFRVDFLPQKVRATVEPEDPSSQLELKLRHGELTLPGAPINNGLEWDLSERGLYTLEVTVGELRSKPSRLSFVVRESYATAVGLLAHRLLVARGQKPPASLVGAFELELVLNAEPGLSPGGS